MRDHIIAFIITLVTQNRLVTSILADLSDDVVLCSLRALGIFDMMIIRHMWYFLLADNKAISLLDMNEVYHTLVLWLDDVVKLSPQQNFAAIKAPFETSPVSTNNQQFQILISEDNFPVVFDAFQTMCAKAVVMIWRQAADHLPGGILSNLSPTRIDSSKIQHGCRICVCQPGFVYN